MNITISLEMNLDIPEKGTEAYDNLLGYIKWQDPGTYYFITEEPLPDLKEEMKAVAVFVYHETMVGNLTDMVVQDRYNIEKT